MTNPYERHKRRWLIKGGTDSEEYLNEAIENFNSLIDNMETPSVHTVDFTLPFECDINNKFKENVLISDMNQLENIMDLKTIHVKLNSKLTSGSLVFWDNIYWIVANEEHKSVHSNKTYFMRKCAINLNLLVEGVKYNYPVYISNLTLYSDGKKELANIDVSSAKYSIYIIDNDITKKIDVGTRFIINKRAFEISLIDDFTVDNVRILTICETVINSKDDLENNVAYNDNSDIPKNNPLSNEINGSDIILIGDTLEYKCLYASAWELEYNSCLELISQSAGKCILKCKSDSNLIGKLTELKAYDSGGNVIARKAITIGGIF